MRRKRKKRNVGRIYLTIFIILLSLVIFILVNEENIRNTISKSHRTTRENITSTVTPSGSQATAGPDTSSDNLQNEVNDGPEVSNHSNDNNSNIGIPDPYTDESIMNAVISPENLPSNLEFRWDIIHKGTVVKNYTPEYEISFGAPDTYAQVEGITTYRGNNHRNGASYGYAEIKEEKLEKVWWFKIGFIDTWTGIGWTGQPAIIKWEESTKEIMNINESKKSKKDLKEVIYAALDGNIYFFDLDDGKETRPPINTGYPYKGSVSVDPRGYPLLYAGQGIDEVTDKEVEIGFRIFNLINQEQIFFINGLDKKALRYWGAFDSSALIDAATDTLIQCGENSLLYKVKLNTNYNKNNKHISINPEITCYRYYSLKNLRLGIENSPAVFRNYVYFQDNEGILQCVDINTLSPVWIRDVTDDSDSTIAIDVENDGKVSLYTACEIDHQGNEGYSYIRKINALNGELIWENKYSCIYDGDTNGGVLAAPVIGKHDIENLVIYSIAKTDDPYVGKLIAFDKRTGKEIWKIDLDYYSWSSPVDVYTKEGKGYIIFCDSAGYMYLIDGKTGTILDKIILDGNVEGSPAVYENMIVVGTRGQHIWGIKLK